MSGAGRTSRRARERKPFGLLTILDEKPDKSERRRGRRSKARYAQQEKRARKRLATWKATGGQMESHFGAHIAAMKGTGHHKTDPWKNPQPRSKATGRFVKRSKRR